MKKMIFNSVFCSLVFSAMAEAAVDQNLVTYFTSRLSAVESSIRTCDGLNLGPMAISDINLDLTPSVSFGISGILGLTVSPEIDLVFVPPATE